MNIETFLSHFDHVKAAGPEEWSCECPTHDDDDHKSLSIGHKGDKILVYCHAGCNTEDVLAAKGLTMADLKNGQKPAPVIGREVCAYDYVDEDGNLIYQNVRLKLPKEFYFRRPNAKGGWIKNLGGVKRTIYRLPAVIEAARAGGLILWVEGEKDADNATTLGFTATTGGSATSWRKQDWFADYFASAQVVIIADKDGAGRKHARDVYAGLKGVAASVKYLELPGPGKDLTNWLDAGGTADALTTLINDADEGEPPPLASTTVATDEKREYRNTELGLRERFVDEYKGKVKFAHSGAGRGTWVFYDGGRWQYDNTKRASEKMVAIVKKLQLAWLKMEPGTEKNELMKFLVKAETHRTVEAALELASHSTDMACEAAEFDSKLCFLNVENGTLDLRTGELQPHDPGDYLTQYVEHPYIRWSDIPDEQKAEWLKFLFTVCSGDQEQVGYLQKCIGYSLRGDLGERVFFFIYGPGGNGKTQLFIALINNAAIHSFNQCNWKVWRTGESGNVHGSQVHQ